MVQLPQTSLAVQINTVYQATTHSRVNSIVIRVPAKKLSSVAKLPLFDALSHCCAVKELHAVSTVVLHVDVQRSMLSSAADA